MHRLARALTLLLPLGGLLFWQGPPPARAQSGTLHLPEHPREEAAPRAPRPAPLTPVHEDQRHHTPVVHPRRETRRHRPAARHVPPHPVAAKPAPKPPPAKPVAAVPAKPKKPPPPPPDPNKGTSTGLPLPRFAALRADEVNLRAGPGMRYPIEWVYKRRYLPVEIEREFDVWRLVAMPDGTRGWVNAATLIGRRTFDVEHQEATLRAEPREAAAAVAILKPGVVGRIRSCTAGSDWCRVQVGQYGGYLRRQEIWGTLPREAIAP